MTRLGVAIIARPTFDVPYAREMAEAAWQRLGELGHELVGSPEPILDAAALAAATATLSERHLDAVVLVHATFTDATVAAAVADSNPAPLLLWGIPEERTGGRLRLNSFCGMNLAGYRLTREGRRYRFLYRHPGDATATEAIETLLDAPSPVSPSVSLPPSADSSTVEAMAAADDVRSRLSHTTVGIVGKRPDGFEPCDYDVDVLAETAGVTAEAATLRELFDRAEAAPAESSHRLRERVAADLVGVDDLDPDGLDRSLRLHVGLRQLIDERGWSGVATRCWPECFTEFGGACCSPHSLLSDEGVPGCCEADAYGTVTSLVLQWLGDGPAFVADLVDLDRRDGTGVFWHCGLAPLAMANPDVLARATVHSNRRQPLLNEFPLRPGRVTISRLSQSRGLSRLTIGGGEMLDAPLPFAGTGGVIRFDRPVEDVLETIMVEGHEHHYGIVYGDVRPQLEALAARLELPVIEL